MTSPSDPFKVLHKRYRQTNCGPFTLSNNDIELVDLNALDKNFELVQQIDYDLDEDVLCIEKFKKFKVLFKNFDEWKFFTLKNGPKGLILIPGIFKDHYSKDLFDQLLYELPKEYSSLKSNIDLPVQNLDSIEESNLRWFTFGYHYDWTKKIYLKDDYHKTPPLLDELINCLKEILKLDLKTEAGIVNYYTCKSKLNPHSDCREENLKPPLLSISLGEKAIFLIGKHRYEKQVIPLVLRDGDIMIMSDESRLAYHSISRIVCNDSQCKRKLIKRININIRQSMKFELSVIQ